ncbi:helix-turn-helix transcriptional regulator [Pseudomonas benzenivorans]|uniref:Helix-turn-helix transcriptional regulator n=1 Tax=Pseudomonas benzenivorans TaxID=556533 RepID=A0ABZ0Q1G8_9PSED|nr:helix-turn-helix transcriptional regulator [Pseudomonas benzenivorans]WPC06549.1 helix-turn-helix transcriptional regulator [Pseudomonas benzenivorans]
MQELIKLARAAQRGDSGLPFSVYSSYKEQRILNAPITKPLLIFVLAGVKQLGRRDEIVCPTGSFLFLSNASDIDMRNIPGDEYFAVLIEFEFSDFDRFKNKRSADKRYVQGGIDEAMAKTLKQYIEWSLYAPQELWHFRREELLQLIYLSGYTEVSNIVGHPSLSHRLHDIVSDNISSDWSVGRLAERLAVSESTLRRRLKAEGASIKSTVNRARLGQGLFLLQTTMEPIGRIAERCGYHSQSRFTDRFKQQFGITPSELRKTREPD